MAETSDGPPFDPEASFYGPGALTAWYLTFPCVLLTWTLHPTKHFTRLSLSADVVLYTLLASLAAGHMTVLLRHFRPDDITVFIRFLEPVSTSRTEAFEQMDPALRKMILVLFASFRVGVMFLWTTTISLLCVMDGEWPGVRPRRWRPLPWVLFISELSVFGCFCFMAARCGLGIVLWGVFSYSFRCAVYFFMVAVVSFITVFSCGGMVCALLYILGATVIFPATLCLVPMLGFVPRFLRPVSRSSIFKELSLTGRSARRRLCTFIILLVIVPFFCYIFLCIAAFTPLITWVLLRLVWGLLSELWFPDLGVRVSSFEQILSLSSGIIALLFAIKAVRGDELRRKFADVRGSLMRWDFEPELDISEMRSLEEQAVGN